MTGYISEIRSKIGHDMLIVVGAGVFVFKGGRLLLQKRRDNGLWAMHGGGMEVGETLEQTARRELHEETGLIANSLELLGVFSGEGMIYTYPNGDQACIVAASYICTDFSGELLPETDETAELRWFNLSELPDDISPPDRKPLAAFLKYVDEHGNLD